jgi:DNA repair protein RadC
VTRRDSHKSTGIVTWPKSERPRERLLSRGPQDVTDGELLAILLRVGVRGKSAVELGHELLKQFGSLQAMMNAPLAGWRGIKGLGMAKIAQLQAALELGRRASLPRTTKETFVKNTRQAADYFLIRLQGLAEEHFRVVFLNRLGRLLDDSLIAHGTADTVRPHLRTIIAHSLRTNASALIAGHNHPSGAAEPSESDKMLTRDLIAACHPIGVKVLDHVIIAGSAYYSFADAGLLDELGSEAIMSAAT